MPRLHSLELVPDAAGCDVVRGDWQALRDAGLPSQLDHRGTSNTPHLTLVAAPVLRPEDEQRAVDLIGTLLPLEVQVAGIALLGGDRVTLVRVVDVHDEVDRAVLALREKVPDRQHVGWLPHVTLGRRIPRTEVAAALAVLPHDHVALRFTELRRWDPDTGTVRTL